MKESRVKQLYGEIGSAIRRAKANQTTVEVMIPVGYYKDSEVREACERSCRRISTVAEIQPKSDRLIIKMVTKLVKEKV